MIFENLGTLAKFGLADIEVHEKGRNEWGTKAKDLRKLPSFFDLSSLFSLCYDD